MAYTRWNDNALARYDERVKNEISRALAEISALKPYVGYGNSKTDCVEEGTSAGLAGTCCEGCRGTCREGCYAIVHQDGVYPNCRIAHANNTVLRRANAEQYYEVFFEIAEKVNKPLRINESGDFDNEGDIFALINVAIRHPSVKVIGYTHRRECIAACAEANKLNQVWLRFSVGIDGDTTEAESLNVPTAAITFDERKILCLNQLFKAKGQKWTCRMCAEKGKGCFGARPMVFDAH